MILGERREPAMAAGEVRALRDELGWTQEQLADAAGVSPLEVSAWEAGAVPVLPEEAAALARAACRGRRERAWDAAGVRPCAWGAEIRARLERIDYADLDQLRRAARKLRVHERRCAACARAVEVERQAQPEPGPGDGLASIIGAVRTGAWLPAPLRLPYSLVKLALTFVVAALVLEGVQFVLRPSEGFDPPPPVALVLMFAAITGWMLADQAWDEVYFARPLLGGFLKAATMAAPVTAAALWWMSPGILVPIVTVVVLIGLYLAGKEADARQDEQKAASAGDNAVPALPAPRVEPDLQQPPRQAVHTGWYTP
jgi:transcriptional regulator with XRE-family HTH domain